MSEAILYIKHWGNSLGVRLPAALAREAGLIVDQRVRLVVEGDCLVISPVVSDVAEQWLQENKAALESSNAYVKAQGLPLGKYQNF